jgi:DNA-binding HxlR family transcriptional regulator
MDKTGKTSNSGWEQIKEFCDSLTEEEDALTREMVTCISDKWSLWTMSVIAEHARPMRFSRIMEQVEGVSQKSLTKTLRGLERDGLITRKVFAEVPPRVEYAMTSLGSEMLENIAPLWLWVAKAVRRFQDARAAYTDR